MNFMGKATITLAAVASMVMFWVGTGNGADQEYNSGGTENISSPLNMSYPDRVIISNGTVVNLNATMNLWSAPPSSRSSLYVFEGSTLNVGASQSINTYGEVELEGGPNGRDTTIVFGNNSSVTVNGGGSQESGYFGLGTDYQFDWMPGYDNRGKARAIVNGTGVVINANEAFELARDGELIISDGKDLTVTANTPLWGNSNVSGMFIMGEFENLGVWSRWDGYLPWTVGGSMMSRVMFTEPLDGG
ncbi:MAG: hypothetical protein LBQ79_00665, partial [Deltaproteobacteria bacterium]|nr:hypothetical protein [Deltaproteobacteria bacterium]